MLYVHVISYFIISSVSISLDTYIYYSFLPNVWTLIFIIPFFRMLVVISPDLFFFLSISRLTSPSHFLLLFYIHLPAPSFRLAIRFTRAPRPTRPMLASLLAILGALVLIPQPIFFLFFNVIQYLYIYNGYYIHLSYFMFYHTLLYTGTIRVRLAYRSLSFLICFELLFYIVLFHCASQHSLCCISHMNYLGCVIFA